MLENGIIWEDEQNFINKVTSNDNILYWFPGLLS